MKKVKVFVFIALCSTLVCCFSSSDEIKEGISKQQTLSKIELIIYDEVSVEIERSITKTIENNLPVKYSFFDEKGELMSYLEAKYEGGKLISEKGHLFDGTPNFRSSIQYDEADRITKLEIDHLNSFSVTTYTYDLEKIVSKTIFANDRDELIKTFYLNKDGFIYKSSDSFNVTEEAFLDKDNNIVRIESSLEDLNIIYDEINIPPKRYQLGTDFRLGAHKNNEVLFSNNISVGNFSATPKYITSMIRGDDEPDNFEWILGDDKEPLEKRSYNKFGKLKVLTRYIYD